jgi:hypothetical protein
MYATMVRCDLGDHASGEGRWRTVRSLATALGTLPGFVAVVAIETDPAAGAMTAVILVEHQAGLAAAERVITQWQGAQDAPVGRSVQCLGSGEVIAQRGL